MKKKEQIARALTKQNDCYIDAMVALNGISKSERGNCVATLNDFRDIHQHTEGL